MSDPRTTGEHEFAGSLLPWYVNDSLDARERGRVRRHLLHCPACRDDEAFLQHLRSAVRRHESTPIVPAPQPERLLRALGLRERRTRRLRVAGLAGGVTALVALVFAAGIVLSGLGEPPPARFRTLTSEPRIVAMDYVLELRFEEGLRATDHQRVLRELQAVHVQPGTPDGTYRVTLSIPASSLAELDAFTQHLEARPEIRSASVVAMQLPVQQGR